MFNWIHTLKDCRLIIVVLGLLVPLNLSASTYGSDNLKSPDKIMALAPNLVEILYALEAGDKIIGVSEHTDFPQGAKKLPVVANYLGVQLEKVIAQQPSLILVWKGTTPQKDIEKLTALGIKIEEFSAESMEELFEVINRVGLLVGATQRAEELTAQLSQDYQNILTTRTQQAGLNPSSWPVGFVEIWPQPLTTAGSKTIVGFALSLCGVNNLYAEAGAQYPQASLEKVLAAQPDVIIQPISKANPTKTKDWSGYSFLNAVKDRAIVSPNADALFRWGPRLTDEISRLCSDIHKVIKN